jgi:hypothetical protein
MMCQKLNVDYRETTYELHKILFQEWWSRNIKEGAWVGVRDDFCKTDIGFHICHHDLKK